MEKKYKCMLIFMAVTIFFVTTNISNYAYISYIHKAEAQSQKSFTGNQGVIYALSVMNIQGDKYAGQGSRKSEQYKSKTNFNIHVLLYDSLLKGLELLGSLGSVYILNMRDKVVNYLLAIIYIHKSDGQKEGKQLLLNS